MATDRDSGDLFSSSPPRPTRGVAKYGNRKKRAVRNAETIWRHNRKGSMELYLNKEKTLRLMTNRLNAWIEQKTKNDMTRKNVKNECSWTNITGYHGRLEQLLEAFVRDQSLNADVKDLVELSAKIDAIHATIKEAIPILEKTFTDKRCRKAAAK